MFSPRRQKKGGAARRLVRNVVAGLVIGGAIGSVIGKHVIDKNDEEDKENTDDEKEE